MHPARRRRTRRPPADEKSEVFFPATIFACAVLAFVLLLLFGGKFLDLPPEEHTDFVQPSEEPNGFMQRAERHEKAAGYKIHDDDLKPLQSTPAGGIVIEK
jgi:hypothetical protein